jgi:hypothetical protein
MAFFVPFALGAAAVAAGLHLYKHYKKCENGECSCGCKEDECECGPDCDCECNSSSSLKKKVVGGADFALEKVKSGLQALEKNITEENVEKVKAALQTAESKVASFQEKLKDQPSA